MIPYRTLATIRLYTGKIGLTDDQARWRADSLIKIEDNVYRINREIVFKAGEVIGLEVAPKPYVSLLECLEPKKEVKPQAESVIETVAAVETEKELPKKRGRATTKKA